MAAMAAVAVAPSSAPQYSIRSASKFPKNRPLQGMLGELIRNPGLSYRRREFPGLHCCALLKTTQEHHQKLEELLTVDECIEKMREALGAQEIGDDEQVSVTGKQKFMEMEGDWTFTWNSNGCFYEKFTNEEMTVEGGYHGEGAPPWQADFAGRITTLDLDDRENCLMVAWLRTGFWITAAGRSMVEISLDNLASDASSDELVLRIHLKKSKIVAVVHVSTESWLITRMGAKVFGGTDRWEYSNWRTVLPGRGIRFPCTIKRYPPAGGMDTFQVDRVELQSPSPSLFRAESSVPVSRNSRRPTTVQLDESVDPVIRMVHTLSGHYVVKPLVDGKDIGYFVVDTGASGLSIAPDLAEGLHMESFGEIYVTGVESQRKSRFLRGNKFQLGRLTIDNPLYIEVGMHGVVRGVEPVVGICGFDIFYDCIMEISMKDRTLSMFNPMNYELPRFQSWERMYMLENVPHIMAKVNGKESLFLLDTGAGGVDVIFPKKSVEEYNLLKDRGSFLNAKVKGVNADMGIQALYGEVDTFEVGGHSFEKVKALLFKGDGGLIDFSVYTCGILCEQLLRHFVLVMDYKRSRICFIKK